MNRFIPTAAVLAASYFATVLAAADTNADVAREVEKAVKALEAAGVEMGSRG